MIANDDNEHVMDMKIAAQANNAVQALNLDGSFAQMDANHAEMQLNRSSAPAPLIAKDNVQIDYKMVSKRVQVWDGSLQTMVKFFTQFEEVAGAQGLLPFMLGMVSIIIPVTCTANPPSAAAPLPQGARPDPLLETQQHASSCDESGPPIRVWL